MSAVDTPHLILFEFFIKIQALLQEPFVFRLVCTFLVCVHVPACARVRVYRDIIDIYLARNGTNLAYLYPSVHILMCVFILFFCVVRNLEIWEIRAGDSRPWTGHPGHSLPVSFVQGTLTQP